MPDGSDTLSIRTAEAIGQVDAAAWDACAGAGNPFVSHAFLLALEESGSAVPETGWIPRPLLVEDAAGRLRACAPLYLKTHSYGEYVFDWSWAEAWQQAGRDYYPKLQCCVPFTPVTGPRLLIRPDAPGRGELGRGELMRAMAAALSRMAEQAGLSSVHVTFPREEEARALEGAGWLPRLGEQYHWTNAGYGGFDDFLDTLASRKRKAIRKERERARAEGLSIRMLTGDDIKPAHWDAFYRFYRNTTDRKWGRAYLTRDFFRRLGALMADQVVLMLAERDGALIAGALNLRGGDTLYGRNWGAVETVPFLHFELCYYRAIDFAIEHRLARVEAGAQGEHKIARGYLPVPTWSAHWIREAPLRQAVSRFLAREREMVARDMAALEAFSPYRRDGEG